MDLPGVLDGTFGQAHQLPIVAFGLVGRAFLTAAAALLLANPPREAPGPPLTVAQPELLAAAARFEDVPRGPQAAPQHARAIRQQAAVAADAVIAAASADGVAEQDIKTLQFSIGPRYDNSNGQSVLRGYVASNVLQVKIHNLDSTGKVIDDATAAGGDAIVVQGISFTIENADPLTHQARLLAMQDAMTKANDYATAAGATLGPVISIIEQSSATPTPVLAAPAPAAAASAPRTPVEVGTQQIRVQVSVVFQLQ